MHFLSGRGDQNTRRKPIRRHRKNMQASHRNTLLGPGIKMGPSYYKAQVLTAVPLCHLIIFIDGYDQTHSRPTGNGNSQNFI